MASEDDESIDEIEEELARVEREIRELEREEGQPPEPEPPDPEPDDVEAPDAERAFDDDLDIEREPGRLSRLADRLRGSEDDEDDAEDEGGLLAGVTDRLGSGDEPEEDEASEDEADDEPGEAADDEPARDDGEADDAVAEPEPASADAGEPDEPDAAPEPEPDEIPEDDGETDEPEDADDEGGGLLAGLTDRLGSEDDEPDPDQDDPEQDDPEQEEAEEGGLLAGVADRFGSGDEPDEEAEEPGDDEADGEPAGEADPEVEDATAEADGEEDPEAEADEGDADDDGGLLAGVTDRFGSGEEAEEPGDDAPADEEPAVAEAGEDDDGEGPRASALLARFRSEGGGPPDEPDAEGEDDEEDEDRSKLLVAGLALLVLLAAAAAAYYLTRDDGPGGQPVAADLVADTFTDDAGSYVATAGEPLRFDARNTQGPVEEYRWAFGDGENETTTAPTVTHRYASAGAYTVELTAVGPDTQATAQIEVSVIQAPSANPSVLVGGEPAAEPGTVGNNPLVGVPVTLDGTDSSADPDHEISSYAWDVDGDGTPDATGPTAEVTFDLPGRWVVDLTVTDDLGNEANDTRVVHATNRLVREDTVGPSTGTSDAETYNVSVDAARGGVEPVELELRLAYNSSRNDTGGLPVQPSVDSDLDLNVTDPEGNVFAAEDDSGGGNETLTVPESDLSPLGSWTAAVSQDTTEGDSTQEVEFRLVVDVVY